DDHPLDRGVEVCLLQPRLEGVGDLVVPTAVGTPAGTREDRRLDQPAVSAGVAAARDAEHALAHAHGLDLALLGRHVGHGDVALLLGHLSRPFICEVGTAWRASVSLATISRRAFEPSFL